MVGLWSEHASEFLVGFGGLAGVVFAVPLFLVPLTWARVFRWNLPDDTDLAIYFGRCLGVLAVALSGYALCAGITGHGIVPVFQIMIPVFIGMTLAHIWGAFRRIQPVTETIEIGFWAGLIVLGLLFYPG